MSHEDFTLREEELNALRENLPATVEEAVSEKFYPVAYSRDLAKRICNYVAEGETLKAIARKNGMPDLGTLIRWKRDNADFAKMLRAVRETRAYLFEDKAIEEADALDDPKMVGVAKVKIDTYWKAAEANDPTVYGKKVEHKGEIGHSVKIFKVHTGFGPLPEALQFPKLNPDGTIQKVIKEVQNEVSHEHNGAGDQDGSRTAHTEGHTGSAESPRSEDARHGSVDRESGGVKPLQSEQGHTASDGSTQGT